MKQASHSSTDFCAEDGETIDNNLHLMINLSPAQRGVKKTRTSVPDVLFLWVGILWRPTGKAPTPQSFFCQQLDPDQDTNRRSLEKELGRKIRFFPLPCSGRIEVLHLLKALETGAEKVYLITCPEGACRYRQGNVRAGKRLEYAQSLIREIEIPAECLEIVRPTGALPLSIDALVRKLLGLAPAKDKLTAEAQKRSDA